MAKLGDSVYCTDLAQDGILLAVTADGVCKLQLEDGSEVEVKKRTLRIRDTIKLTAAEMIEGDYETDEEHGYIEELRDGWHRVRYPLFETADPLVLTGIHISQGKQPKMQQVQLQFNHGLRITSYSMFFTDSGVFKPAKERGYLVFNLEEDALASLRDAVKDVYKVIVG